MLFNVQQLTKKVHTLLKILNNILYSEKIGWRSKMVTGTHTQTAWVLWIRDLEGTPQTLLAEVKHQGELKLQHPEPLMEGRLFEAMTYWKNSQATAHWASTPQACQAPALPASQTTASPDPALQSCQTATPSAPCSAGQPGHCPPSGPPPHQPQSGTRVLYQHQMLASNLLRRCRQTTTHQPARPLPHRKARLLLAGLQTHQVTTCWPARPPSLGPLGHCPTRPLPCRTARLLPPHWPRLWPTSTPAASCHKRAPTPPDTGSKPA
jgi:hypothetical protein